MADLLKKLTSGDRLWLKYCFSPCFNPCKFAIASYKYLCNDKSTQKKAHCFQQAWHFCVECGYLKSFCGQRY